MINKTTLHLHVKSHEKREKKLMKTIYLNKKGKNYVNE